MDFEWDENKNQSNIEKHGFSFETAIAIFDSYVVTFDSCISNTEEQRQMTIGLLEATVITIIHIHRDRKVRIISARKASRKERRIYNDYLKREGITAA